MSDRASPALPTLRDVLRRAHLRLIIFAVVMAGFVLAFSGFIIMKGYAERNLSLVAQTVGYTVEPAVVFGDVDAVEEGVALVASINDVRVLEVVDAEGGLLTRWERPKSGMRAQLEDAGARLIWPRPVIDRVERHGKVVAEVRVYGGLGGFAQFLQSGALVAISFLGLTLVATQMLSRRLTEDVLDPLAHVTEVAHEVRTNRTFGKRVPASGIFEIDQFGQDFNALLTELEGWGAYLELENEELARKATHDGLTGLGNRSLFERKLALASKEASRTQKSFAMLYIDANKFKQINDTYGHEAGDAILRAIAARLTDSIRSNDAAFRLGGDEFAVILGSPVARADVERVLERISASMQQEIALPDGPSIQASLSIGFAVCPDDGSTLAEIMRRADAEMYADKQRRKRQE